MRVPLLLLLLCAVPPSLATVPVNPFCGAYPSLAEVVAAVHHNATGLHARAVQLQAQFGIPGISLAVVFNGTVVALEGLGVRRVGATGDNNVTVDTVFPLASLSKPLSSTVLARLLALDEAKNGGHARWAWDTPIAALDPHFQLRTAFETAEVTVKDLLSHRSGLPDHAGDLIEDIGFDAADVFARLHLYTMPRGAFRSRYAYTNFGFSEAAFAVAKARAATQTWADQAEAHLFGPAGMNSTSFRYADLTARDNRAFGHMQNTTTGLWYVSSPQRDPDEQSPAAGGSSSARDMAAWMLLHFDATVGGSGLVPISVLGPTHEPLVRTVNASHTPNEPQSFYGLGWNVGVVPGNSLVRLSHSGAFNLGTATAVTLVPALGLGIVVLSNSAPRGVPEVLAAEFVDTVLYGKPLHDYTLNLPAFQQALAPLYGIGANYSGTPPAPFKGDVGTLVGTYADNVLYGSVEVVRLSTVTLGLRLGPEDVRGTYHLQPWNGNTWLYQPRGENAGGLAKVVFGHSKKGKSLMLEDLERGLDPTFVPVGEGIFWQC